MMNNLLPDVPLELSLTALINATGTRVLELHKDQRNIASLKIDSPALMPSPMTNVSMLSIKQHVLT